MQFPKDTELVTQALDVNDFILETLDRHQFAVRCLGQLNPKSLSASTWRCSQCPAYGRFGTRRGTMIWGSPLALDYIVEDKELSDFKVRPTKTLRVAGWRTSSKNIGAAKMTPTAVC